MRCASRSFFLLAADRVHLLRDACSAVGLRRATSISAGSFSRRSASSLISSLKVAENSRLCFFCGSTASTFLMSWMKPMSSMRSASSSTKISTWRQVERALLWWSSRRPGVATRMSTPRRSLSICGCMPTPPKITMLVELGVLAVGANAFFDLRREFARGRQDQGADRRCGRLRVARPRALAIRRCSIGSVKPAVLPVPVWAPASRSPPRARRGSPAPGWGWGCRSPVRARRAADGSARPRVSKVMGVLQIDRPVARRSGAPVAGRRGVGATRTSQGR